MSSSLEDKAKELSNISDNTDKQIYDTLPPDIKSHVKPDDIKMILSMATMVTSRSYSGPLPPAEQFARYESVQKGAANCLLNYMDREQAHRHIMDKRRFSEIYRGQFLGFLSLLSFISASVFLSIQGHEAVAGIFVGAAALGIVGKFIDGRKTEIPKENPTKKNNRSKKR